MGVYIKDMTLDKFSEYGDYCKMLIGTGQAEEVPPHGRLIDADVLYRRIKTECNPYGKPTINFNDGNKVMGMIAYASTIIPASEEKT